MKVRAKMRCNCIMDTGYGNIRVMFNAVYSDNPDSENKVFSDATPAAYVDMNIQKDKPAAQAFEINKCYYVDFSEAPDE